VNLLLVFPLLAAPPRCVRQVELWLYRTWAAGGPFPSRQRSVRKGTPLVVDVRTADFGQPVFEARIAPLGDPETAPHLRWTAARDC
ncbi:MAG TPA: hypothetical protein VEY96_11970, partial [Actinomycetes bacterium]|nr:hypothetical protein [Actinomycetes bacterium]